MASNHHKPPEMDVNKPAIDNAPAVEPHPLHWNLMAQPAGLRARSIAGMGIVYALLVLLGHELREDPAQLPLMWPAAGVLLAALWLAPPRNWPWMLALQVIIEIGIDRVLALPHGLAGAALTAAANSLGAVVGGIMMQRLVEDPGGLDIAHVVRFFLAAAAGAAAGAVLGAYATLAAADGAVFLHVWQLWWAGHWVGTLCTLPVTMVCVIRVRARGLLEPSPPRAELLLLSTALLALIVWIFSAHRTGFNSLLDMPVVVLALLVAVSFRLPARWAFALSAATAILVAAFSSRGLGPYAVEASVLARTGRVQVYLSALLGVTLMMAVVLRQMRDTIRALRISEERYRAFIENSSEAVWRVELAVPMPAQLAFFEQREWLRKHAYIAECNLQYRQLNERATGVKDASPRTWRADVPWSAIYLEHLETAARNSYSMQGLRFELQIEGRARSFLTSFTAVTTGGELLRIWGVAHDVTELSELNQRLHQKQARLQSYAAQLTGTEDRARRAIAVDLHDGIGQQLVGLGMTLESARSRAPADVRAALEEATQMLRDVQGATQRVIADLSPPGLYELGLGAALKWLSANLRDKDGLQVDLQVSADDPAVDLDQRILAFKIVRELLRNVVKHARVKQARVEVTQDPGQLRLEVSDQGVGFEWQLDAFESRDRGFGLWSVVNRVHDAKGEVTVETAPGKGCRVRVMLPLTHGAAQP